MVEIRPTAPKPKRKAPLSRKLLSPKKKQRLDISELEQAVSPSDKLKQNLEESQATSLKFKRKTQTLRTRLSRANRKVRKSNGEKSNRIFTRKDLEKNWNGT